MNAYTYDIEISEYNSAGIKGEAAAHGITHMRWIASGYFWDGIAKGTLFALPVEGGESRVLDIAEGPVWEDAENASEWCDTLRQYGLGDHV